jgi:5-methylcytosine-specific restriction endonuclease McrA
MNQICPGYKDERCRARVEMPDVRCPVHQPMAAIDRERRAASRRGTRTERGYGGDWQKKAGALKATRPTCDACGYGEYTYWKDGVEHVDDLTVDHVVPLADGGGDDDTNLRVVHRSLNSSKGSRAKGGLCRCVRDRINAARAARRW